MHHGEQAALFFMCVSLAGLPTFIAAWLWVRRRPGLSWKLKAILLAVPLGLFIVGNPAGQVIFLLPVELHFRARMCDEAKEHDLVGKPPEAVTALYGEPCSKRAVPSLPRSDGRDPNQVVMSAAYDAWEYAPVPFTIMSHGQHVKVFFRDNVVQSVKCDL